MVGVVSVGSTVVSGGGEFFVFVRVCLEVG